MEWGLHASEQHETALQVLRIEIILQANMVKPTSHEE
jgi:hypothetical protein